MADLGCGAKCAKCIILLINLVFALIGIVLLGFGIFLVIDTKALHNKYFIPLGSSADQMIIAAGIILIVGAAILLVTIIGCCATVKEHTGCLTFYAIILIFLLILQIAAAIVVGVFYNQIIDTLGDKMMVIVKHEYHQPNYNDSTQFIDTVQSNLHCCGVTHYGPLDWKFSAFYNETKQNVPYTCCTVDGTGHVIDSKQCLDAAYDTAFKDRTKYVYIEGCDDKIDQMIKHYVGAVIGVVVGVIIIQVVFIAITCLLRSKISRGYEYV